MRDKPFTLTAHRPTLNAMGDRRCSETFPQCRVQFSAALTHSPVRVKSGESHNNELSAVRARAGVD